MARYSNPGSRHLPVSLLANNWYLAARTPAKRLNDYCLPKLLLCFPMGAAHTVARRQRMVAAAGTRVVPAG